MQKPEIKLNYLNVCVHSRSQDIVAFGHAHVFVIVVALPLSLALTTRAWPRSRSLTLTLSLSNCINKQLLAQTHSHTYQVNLLSHTLARSLTHALCSSTRQAFVRLVCRSRKPTTTKFSRTAAAHSLASTGLVVYCCLCWCWCCFCFWLRACSCVCVCACSRRRRVCVGVSSRRFVLCWFGQRQREQSDSRSRSRSRAQRRRARRSTVASQ